jgi:hypothetical protein
MDQPTSLNISIKGKPEDVKRAALAAQRRIALNTKGFDENAYAFGDGSDFEQKMRALRIRFHLDEMDDGKAEYSTEQESYACIEEEDITGIANEIIKASSAVEAHISAVITITCEEGYDLCVDIECFDGKMRVDRSEEYYDDFEEDEEDEEEK